MKTPIYLDYAATTPVDPRVAQKMSECLLAEGKFGNPASRSHKFGWEAEEAVEIARRQVADLLNCDPREIVWTSGKVFREVFGKLLKFPLALASLRIRDPRGPSHSFKTAEMVFLIIL